MTEFRLFYCSLTKKLLLWTFYCWCNPWDFAVFWPFAWFWWFLVDSNTWLAFSTMLFRMSGVALVKVLWLGSMVFSWLAFECLVCALLVTLFYKSDSWFYYFCIEEVWEVAPFTLWRFWGLPPSLLNVSILLLRAEYLAPLLIDLLLWC